jgi:hypothetical protein
MWLRCCTKMEMEIDVQPMLLGLMIAAGRLLAQRM